jgi:hypothetical protein
VLDFIEGKPLLPCICHDVFDALQVYVRALCWNLDDDLVMNDVDDRVACAVEQLEGDE